ncbi:MAG: hypothetical protein AB8G99_02585 [Planctomycetaceae bacterium]
MSTRAEASSIFTPIIVLAGVVVIVLAAGKVLMQPTGGPSATTQGSSGFLAGLFGSAETTGQSAALDPLSEDQRKIESELQFWSTRLQRAESDMLFAEEVAMSQSDVIGVRHLLGTLDEDIAELHRYAVDYKEQTDQLLKSSDGSRIAGSERLLLQFYDLFQADRMSPREITQFTERIAPLKSFIETLESRSDAAYRPRPQFELRVNRFVNDVSASVEHYRASVFKLRRLQRASMNQPTSAETLEEAIYRLKDEGHARLDDAGRLIPEKEQPNEDLNDEGGQFAMATPGDYRSTRSAATQQPTYQSSQVVHQGTPVVGHVGHPVWVTYQSRPVVHQQRAWRQSCGCRNCRCRCR